MYISEKEGESESELAEEAELCTGERVIATITYADQGRKLYNFGGVHHCTVNICDVDFLDKYPIIDIAPDSSRPSFAFSSRPLSLHRVSSVPSAASEFRMPCSMWGCSDTERSWREQAGSFG